MPYIYDCDYPHELPPDDIAALLGGKAANLSVMANGLGLPVPPAFTLTTQACREYLAHGWPAGLDEELREHMRRLEEQVGRRFGDPADPLLVSVRSGAPVSMPGMMDTILNLGLNDATTAGLGAVSGSDEFARGCRARFESMYRAIVGEAPPADPWAQLRGAIEAVFRSWNSDRARSYRQREGISDELGTGVTVQAMVFGNRTPESGTGVLFTRNPASGEAELYGDFMFNAQGEDVVAGTHNTDPIAVLEERLPALARQLAEAAERLERHNRDVCDIEFTVEDGRLWLLQCRIGKRSPQAALRTAVEMAQSPDFPLTRGEAVLRVREILADPPRVTTERPTAAAVATGVPASPGVASGGIVVSPDAAVAAAAAGRRVILVRTETSPDDVHGMAAAAGILTSTGGRASHAAVVARGWGIPAVVGAASVVVVDGAITIGQRRLDEGTAITIDGSTGEVFLGEVGGATAIVPEAATLLGWAGELGIEIAPAAGDRLEQAADGIQRGAAEGPTSAPGASPAAGPSATTPISLDDVLVVLLVKGYADPDAVATALSAPAQLTAAHFDQLVADGLAEPSVGAFRLTKAGKAAAQLAVGRARDAWGHQAADAALEAFTTLDKRVKSTVTAWQMRDMDGDQIINDHSDAEYDGHVLADLAALHRETVAWLTPIAAAMPRFDAYLARLERANAAAQAGDGRFVASPRVDSYHSIWFELHEDLILHAGRSRADEVAAGRA